MIINDQSIEQLLYKFYQQGKKDAILDLENEKVTLIQLSKELAEKGRKIGVQTLTKKARAAKVKIIHYDGKRLAVYRKHVKDFISI